MTSITDRLLAKVEAINGSRELWCAAAIVGLCVDLGTVSLDEVQVVVDRCGTYDELANRLAVMADDARMFIEDPLPVGCPPGHEHRIFRITGIPEQELAIPGGA